MAEYAPVGTKDLLRIGDLAAHEVLDILETAAEFKRDPARAAGACAGRSVCMLFEKPSLRTRMSFEVGLFRMGGQAIYLDHRDSPLGARETIGDYGRNLERWCHAIVARVRSHATVAGLAAATRVPVVNALCDMHHPCQALADFQTLLERGFDLRHSRLAWIGDGNNVCHSLMELCSVLGCGMTIVTPEGYEPDAGILSQCVARSMRTGARIEVTGDPDAIRGAFAVYTDTWISMGQEESAAKKRAFARYQVDRARMACAGPDALFMHCLPAHRGEEVTDEVIDSANSVVFDEAENRMHAQNALLCHLFAPKPALGAPSGAAPRAAAIAR
ncbi:MAG: ornithine carbamoyltransferase [Phycisphaerales bacterium]